jgi:hypothetical protein
MSAIVTLKSGGANVTERGGGLDGPRSMKVREPRCDPLLSALGKLKNDALALLGGQRSLPCAGDCLPLGQSAHREGKASHIQERSFEDQPRWRHTGLTHRSAVRSEILYLCLLLVPLHWAQDYKLEFAFSLSRLIGQVPDCVNFE